MRKTILAALGAILAACGGSGGPKEPDFTYGAPLAPTPEEQGAADSAGSLLGGTLAAPTTAAWTGAAGLPDQMTSELGSRRSPAPPRSQVPCRPRLAGFCAELAAQWAKAARYGQCRTMSTGNGATAQGFSFVISKGQDDLPDVLAAVHPRMRGGGLAQRKG